MLEFSTSKQPIAKKPHICDLCLRTIQRGEKYERFSGLYNGDFFDQKLHLDCERLIDRYCRAMDDNEYTEDAVLDWLYDTICFDCEQGHHKNDDCDVSVFDCERIKRWLDGERKEK